MTRENGINRPLVLLGLIIGMFFSALEQTIVGTAMPTIIGELQGFEIFAWVTTAYLITSTVVVPIVGKLSDLYGRRWLYLTGTLIFTAGSLLCATANSMEMLILYRAVQGLGGGMVMPLSQTIVGDIFTAEQRAKWQGVFGAIFGLSSVIGPLIGGFLVDTISWHWIFLINVPFGLATTFMVFIGLKRETVAHKDHVEIDYLGIAMLVPGLVLLLLGLSLGGDKFAWNSATAYWVFGGAALFLLLFLLVERRAKEPVLALALFKNRVFAVTNALGFLLGLGMFGAIMFVPMYMQAVQGVSPTKAGSTMTPMMIAMIVASVLGGQLLLRLRYKIVLATGMIIAALGFYLMSTVGLETSQLTVYLYMVVLGFGMGLVMPTLMIAVQNEYQPERLGTVTSASTFFRSMGGTIGITILSAVMNSRFQGNVKDAVADLKDQDVAAAMNGLLSNPDADLFSMLIRPDLLPFPEGITKPIIHLIQSTWTNAFNTVLLTGLGFVAAGIVLSLLVGNKKIERDKPHRKPAKPVPSGQE